MKVFAWSYVMWPENDFERSTLVGQHPMKSLSSVCPLSVRRAVTKFSHDWIMSFSDIVNDDS